MARLNGLDGMLLKDLTDLRNRVEQAIVARKQADKTETKAKMQALAVEAGFSLDELLGKTDGRKSTGKPVAIKYRNPDNPAETWTGRGRQPRWLVAKLAKRGVTREDFAV